MVFRYEMSWNWNSFFDTIIGAAAHRERHSGTRTPDERCCSRGRLRAECSLHCLAPQHADPSIVATRNSGVIVRNVKLVCVSDNS